MNAPWTIPTQRVRAIVEDASALLEVPVNDILSRRKRVDIVQARFAVIWVARNTTDLSFPQIAAALNGRDHSTIMHALARAEQMRAADDDFRAVTNRLRRRAEERNPA